MRRTPSTRWCWLPWSYRLEDASAGVELADHVVPLGNDVPHAGPEGLVAAGREVVDGDALLLHPREVPEVEDALPVAERGLQEIAGPCSEDPSTERLRGGDVVHPLREIAGRDPLPLGGVHLGAVGGHSG